LYLKCKGMMWKSCDEAHNELPTLPPAVNLESVSILKAAIEANKYLAELKGYCETLPNPELLLNTVILQESKDSSAIENIVTTQDDLYRAIISPNDIMPPATKEVISYREAMYTGTNELKYRPVFTGNLAIKIMQKIKGTTAEFRNIIGTKLMNPFTKKIIYTPPDPQRIHDLIFDWENFINQGGSALDPLIVMAIMHYQFEAIHPFADGNGRTGRILNVLFLVHAQLLTHPLLYHSGYIIQHKTDYYKKLQAVTENQEWENWIIFMLEAIKETSAQTLKTIKKIIKLKEDNLDKIKGISQKLPAYELNELIFSFPYVKIQTLIDRNVAKRQAASGYLQQLAERNILHSMKIGKEIYYVNHKLMDILSGR
jgi:Fic family protein